KMYLRENIKNLNEKYNKFGILFELNSDMIQVIEDTPFCLNNNSELKEELRQKYNITFNQIYKWHIRKVDIERLNKKKLAFKPQKLISTLAEDLKKYINQIEEISLKKSIFHLLKNEWKFFYSPAAISYHHNYPYGLLEHTVETIQHALLLYQSKKNIELDRDLIIAGSLLHDIGKINCYELNNEIVGTTQLANTQGHIINGIMIVTKYIKSEKLDQLIHILSSHHNFKEWGSPVTPQSNEAYIIFLADLLSAKLW
ncbi:MAG: HD domain-containing protein, partial [Candidatus Odinarchaeota archaeon]